MKISEIEVDTKAENEGEWVESPRYPGVWAKVRSIHNPDFRRNQQIEATKTRRKYGSQPVPPEVQDRVFARLVVDHVLLDLQGLEDSSGKEIKLSRDFGIEIMSDPKYRRLADFISWAAEYVGENHSEELEETAGNSEPE